MKRIYLFLLLGLFSTVLSADIMNLNEYIPTRLEDATPIDVGTYDAQLSFETERSPGQEENTIRPDLRYGLTKDIQIEALGTIRSGGDERGSGETQLGGLYRFNHSRNYFPEISINPMIVFPTGKSNRGFDVSTKLNLTSTLRGTSNIPLTQLHANIGWATEEDQDEMLYVIGISQHILKNTALVVDVLNEEEKSMLETGLHLFLGSGYFLGVGMGKGLDRKSPAWMGLLALERQM